MKEREILMCSIALILGYLVARMMRGNGLSVGGYTCGEWFEKNIDKCKDFGKVPVDSSTLCILGQPIKPPGCNVETCCKDGPGPPSPSTCNASNCNDNPKATVDQSAFCDNSCKDGGLGCNAFGIKKCKFCGFRPYNHCPTESEYSV